jgi:hypothetical protein
VISECKEIVEIEVSKAKSVEFGLKFDLDQTVIESDFIIGIHFIVS